MVDSVLHIFRDDYLYYGIYIYLVKYHQHVTSHPGKQCALLEKDTSLEANAS